MLLKDNAQRTALLDELSRIMPSPVMAGDAGDLIERVRGSVDDPDFPGAVLVTSSDDRLAFYAVAATGPEWRELVPLLMASVGVTTTDFTGRANQGSGDDPIAQMLRARGMFAVSRFEAYSNRERIALGALARLRTLVQKAGTLPRTLPRSTSQALYEFRSALAAGDHAEADNILTFLREGMRMDALNRSFLEVRLDEAFGDWNRLVARGSFQALCLTRRPPAVTAAMVEAIYHTTILPAEEIDDPHAALGTFRRDVLGHYGSLFTICPPQPRPVVGKAFLLAALATEIPDLALIERLDKVAQSWPEDEVKFYHQLRTLVPSSSKPIKEAATQANPIIGQFDYEAQLVAARDEQIPPTLERANAVMVAAMNVQSLDAYQIALAYVSRLDATSRERLLAMPFMRPVWEVMSQYSATESRVPRDWREWIQLLPSMKPSQAATWADAAVTEYPIAQQLQHPEDVDILVAALDNPPIGVQAQILDALPALVEWVKEDDRWPNKAYLALYKQLFELLLYSSNRSDTLYKALSTLLIGMFAVGLNRDQYRTTLADLGDTLPELSGSRDLDWLCDLAELTITYPCPDPDGRSRFWHQLIAVMVPYRARLTSAQHRVLADVAEILGLSDTLAALPAVPSEVTPTARRTFNHSVVGIYTLTEGVGERVARLLAEEYPGINVRVNHDTVSTPQLRELAKRADIFVICWLSAKHAATGSIAHERPADRKTIYAPGKGSSSICREIRQYLDSQVAIS